VRSQTSSLDSITYDVENALAWFWVRAAASFLGIYKSTIHQSAILNVSSTILTFSGEPARFKSKSKIVDTTKNTKRTETMRKRVYLGNKDYQHIL
jgi:hypothetical protein